MMCAEPCVIIILYTDDHYTTVIGEHKKKKNAFPQENYIRSTVVGPIFIIIIPLYNAAGGESKIL